MKHFESLENPGVLGVAGNSYHPLTPSDWWVPAANHRHFNFISNNKNGRMGDGVLRSSKSLDPCEVFCLDGVFISVKTKIFLKFLFDENLEGFHGYDTSLSLRVSKDYKNYFIPDILIEHFSSGNYTREFWKNTVCANLVYSNFFRKENSVKIDYKIEFYSFKSF